jgi:NhaP-type Na+/H+ or K+/H+ antiporter
MRALFASGAFLDLVLACTLLEAAAITLLRRRRGSGPTLAQLAPALAAGAFLVLAMRTTWTGGHWALAAAFLLAALAAHAIDLARRWR